MLGVYIHVTVMYKCGQFMHVINYNFKAVGEILNNCGCRYDLGC